MQQSLGVVHEVGVERIVPGDQDGHGIAPALTVQAGAACPARFLPERGPRARPAGDDHRVQARDVDAQFEGRGGCQRGDGPAAQSFLEVAPLLRQVSGPVGGYPVRQVGRAGLGQPAPGGGCRRLGAPA